MALEMSQWTPGGACESIGTSVTRLPCHEYYYNASDKEFCNNK